jgi:beta-phosphoglucomutase-like phosphatase (HAD superfamily)
MDPSQNHQPAPETIPFQGSPADLFGDLSLPERKAWKIMQAELITYVEPLLDHWREQFRERGIEIQAEVGGSLACDLFRGPKPSRNPSAAEHYIEYDLRLYLPSEIHPQADETKRLIQEVTGLEWKKDYHTDRWRLGMPTDQSIFYGYAELEEIVLDRTSLVSCLFPNATVEFEVSVQRESDWVEITRYWGELFSHDEIDWQAECRRALRNAGVPYEEGIQQLKEWQNDMARWRLLAAFSEGLRGDLPPELVSPLVESWSERPYPQFPSLPLELPAPPEVPPAFAAIEAARGVQYAAIFIQQTEPHSNGLHEAFSIASVILSDMDGVLHSSEQLAAIWAPVWEEIFVAARVPNPPTGADLHEAGLFSRTSLASLDEGIRDFLRARFESDLSPEELGEILTRGLRESIQSRELIASPGAVELLTIAQSVGLQVGVVSNSNGAYLSGLLERLGIASGIGIHVSSDDVGAEHSKPSVIPWRHALTGMGIEPEQAGIIVLEDSAQNLGAALRAHPEWRGVLVSQDGATPQNLEDVAERVFVVTSLEEVRDALAARLSQQGGVDSHRS